MGAHTNTKQVRVAPVNEDLQDEEAATRTDKIVQEEKKMWEDLGGKGFRPGPNGELPDGFHFDEEGNVIVSINNESKAWKQAAFIRFMNKYQYFAVYAMYGDS